MTITVMGRGYVGPVIVANFSSVDINVTCAAIDQNKIDGIKNSILPIYEPVLEKIMKLSYEIMGRLNFSAGISDAIRGSNAGFIAVATTSGEVQQRKEN